MNINNQREANIQRFVILADGLFNKYLFLRKRKKPRRRPSELTSAKRIELSVPRTIS